MATKISETLTKTLFPLSWTLQRDKFQTRQSCSLLKNIRNSLLLEVDKKSQAVQFAALLFILAGVGH